MTETKPNFHPHVAGRKGVMKTYKEFKGDVASLPDTVTCRGKLALGTGCGKCSKCRREYAEVFKSQATVHELFGQKLKFRWGPFATVEEAEAKTSTARKIETSQGKVFAIVARATKLL